MRLRIHRQQVLPCCCWWVSCGPLLSHAARQALHLCCEVGFEEKGNGVALLAGGVDHTVKGRFENAVRPPAKQHPDLFENFVCRGSDGQAFEIALDVAASALLNASNSLKVFCRWTSKHHRPSWPTTFTPGRQHRHCLKYCSSKCRADVSQFYHAATASRTFPACLLS